MSKSPSRLKTTLAQNKRKVISIGNFLLRGMQGPICQLDSPARKSTASLDHRPGTLLESNIRIQPSNYYTFLVVQACSDDVTGRSLRDIKMDFRALEQLSEGAVTLVMFSSIL